jgi:uncharacterized lipoprotein YmbA
MPISRRWLMLAAIPAACTSPNPTLYTLAAVPGPVVTTPLRVIEIRTVAIARYLERSQIVRSSEDYRLEIIGNDWWGEPLDAMLTRVLVQDLTQRLPGCTVFGDNGAVSATPDLTVAVNVQRFDQGRDGAVVLLAQLSVTGGGRENTRALRLTAAPSAVGTPGLVAAMSTLVGELADVAAGMVRG